MLTVQNKKIDELVTVQNKKVEELVINQHKVKFPSCLSISTIRYKHYYETEIFVSNKALNSLNFQIVLPSFYKPSLFSIFEYLGIFTIDDITELIDEQKEDFLKSEHSHICKSKDLMDVGYIFYDFVLKNILNLISETYNLSITLYKVNLNGLFATDEWTSKSALFIVNLVKYNNYYFLLSPISN